MGLTILNNWIMGKIAAYLATKEGCSVETSNNSQGAIVAYVQDSLGFRYEIKVKALGRIENDMSDSDYGPRKLSSNIAYAINKEIL